MPSHGESKPWKYGIKSLYDNTLIAYGRGANALVRQAKSEGVNATQIEMQTLIDNFYNTFPKVKLYVEACHRAVRDPGYVENAFGRRRYFGYTKDAAMMKAKERQAQNAPIQGTVAEALSIALCNLFIYRAENDMKYKLVLPVHDAIFLMVPFDEVKRVIQEVFPICMGKRVPIPGTKLVLGVDIAAMRRWGDKLSTKELEEIMK